MEYDARKTSAEQILETSLIMNYVSQRQEILPNKDTETIAVFVWNDFCWLNSDGKYTVSNLLQIEISLESRSLLAAKLDGEDLAPEVVLILMCHFHYSAQHVRIHGYAADGCATGSKDAFIRRNAVNTIMYNYFGQHYGDTHGTLYSLGITPTDAGDIRKIFDHGRRLGKVNLAGPWKEIAPNHSEFGRFVLELKGYFEKTFEEYKEDFPGVHVEALYNCTVIHALDHDKAGWIVENPYWFSLEFPKFKFAAEVVRVIRAGFLTDVVGIPFVKNFRDAPHPFYQAIYERASVLNSKLADEMDTCIIK